MLQAAIRQGYAEASIAQTISHAGVSRPTFYDYFTDKDDCFLTLCAEIAEEMADQVTAAISQAPPAEAIEVAIQASIGFAEADYERARFFMSEAPGAGQRALDKRDETIERIEGAICTSLADAAPDALVPDVPLRALIGGLHWLLAPLLRGGERELETVSEDLSSWLKRYQRPLASHRWRTLEPGPEPGRSSYVADRDLSAPPATPPGHTKLSPAELASNQRRRILLATADTVAEKGYQASTVADITAAAGVDRRVFYSYFRNKEQAFLTVHELAFRQTMAVAAGAFFSGATWPERVWEGFRAFAQFQAEHARLAHMGFVDSYTVGSAAVRRVEDNRTAFTIFLQEGYQGATDQPPRITMDAIAAMISEIGYYQVRRRQIELFPRRVGHACYLVLAPFLGCEQADAFVVSKLTAAQRLS